MSAHVAPHSLTTTAAAAASATGTQSTFLLQTSLPPSQPPQRSAAASFRDSAPPVPHHRVRFSHHSTHSARAPQSSYITVNAVTVQPSVMQVARNRPSSKAEHEPVVATGVKHKRKHKPHRKSRHRNSGSSNERKSRHEYKISNETSIDSHPIENNDRHNRVHEEAQRYLSLPAASASPDEALLTRRLQRTHTAQPTREDSHPYRQAQQYNEYDNTPRRSDEVHSASSRRAYGNSDAAALFSSPSPVGVVVVGPSGTHDIRRDDSFRYIEDRSSLPDAALCSTLHSQHPAPLHHPYRSPSDAGRRQYPSPQASTLRSTRSHRHHRHSHPRSVSLSSSSSLSTLPTRASKKTRSRSHKTHKKHKQRKSHSHHHHRKRRSSDDGSEERYMAYQSLIVTPRSRALSSHNDSHLLPSQRATVYVRIHPARSSYREMPYLYKQRDNYKSDYSTRHTPHELIAHTSNAGDEDGEEAVDGGEVRVSGVSVRHTAIRDLLQAVQQCLPFMPGAASAPLLSHRSSRDRIDSEDENNDSDEYDSDHRYRRRSGSRDASRRDQGNAHGWLEIHRADNTALRYFFHDDTPEVLVLSEEMRLSDVLDVTRLRGAHIAEGQLLIYLHWHEDAHDIRRTRRGSALRRTSRHARRIPAPPLEKLTADDDTQSSPLHTANNAQKTASDASSSLNHVSPAVRSLRASYHYHVDAQPKSAWPQVTDVIEYDNDQASGQDDAPSSRGPPTRPWPYVYEGESQMFY